LQLSCADSVGEHKRAEEQHQTDLANNQAPVFINVLPNPLLHPENQTYVGKFTASDADGDGIQYSVKNAGGAEDAKYFMIDASNGELRFLAPPNYESTKIHYSIILVASDALESGELPIDIDIEDKNEAPVIVAPDEFRVAENSTAIAKIDINDEDGDAVNVSIVNDSSNQVIIDSSGQLSFKTPQNYESGIVFDFTVMAIENTPAKLSSTHHVVVHLSDQNDAPVFTSPTSIDTNENTTQVTTLTAADEDVNDGDKLRFSLSGADAKYFVINPDSGELSLVQPLDYEQLTNPVLHIIATVTDPQSSSTSENFSININNVFDLDSRFDGDGMAEYLPTVDGSDFVFLQLIPTNDEGVLILGYYKLTNSVIGNLFKVDTNGNKISNFGSNGDVFFSYTIPDTNGSRYRVETTSTNDIFLIWSEPTTTSAYPQVHLQKYYSTGQLDSSYGNNGALILTQVFDSTDAIVRKIDTGTVRTSIRSPDGGFYVAGQNVPGYGSSVAVWKFDANGALDTSFGKSGVYFNESMAYLEHLTSIANTNDGGFALAGETSVISSDVTIWKFNNKLTPDLKFGVDGILTTSSDAIAFPTDLLGTLDGGMILSTYASIGELVKINPQFEIDLNFWGTSNRYWDGTYFLPNENNIQSIKNNSLINTSDGGFLVMGESEINMQISNLGILFPVTFWKFDSNLQLDSRFGNNGIFVDYFHDAIGASGPIGYGQPFKFMDTVTTSDGGTIAACDSRINNVGSLILWKFH